MLVTIVLFSVILTFFSANSEEVQGCGGYVKSDVEINFSQVGIKLYTAQGSLKHETECAPNDGYYFIPVFDKGPYVIKIAPPSGWSMEPREVTIDFDGRTDPCSRKEDINFHFKGFAVLGQVSSPGVIEGGPSGVVVSLHKGSQLVQSTETGDGGHFVFTPLAAGTYTVTVTHPTWNFIANSTTVSISDQNGEVAAGSLVVRGYALQGTVQGDGRAAPAGVAVILYIPEDNTGLKHHYEKYPPGCTGGVPAGHTSQHLLGVPLCHTLTDAKGGYTFTGVAPGRYFLAAHHSTPRTEFVLAPGSLAVAVQHENQLIRETFKLEGFSVRGRVLLASSGAGVVGATVALSGRSGATAVTAEDGSYTLPSVKAGRYTITVTADALQFSPVTVTLSATNPTVGDISPSHYTACFTILLDGGASRGQTWNVQVSSAKGLVSSVNVDVSGHACVLLPPGEYSVAVHLTEEQQKRGIRFGPARHALVVSGAALPSVLVFSQFLGEVRVVVSCLEACPSGGTTVVLQHDEEGTPREAVAVAGSKGFKAASVSFKEVVPGKYHVLVQKDDWCWKQKSLAVEVNTENVEVKFDQTGYILTVTSSHAATLTSVMQGNDSLTVQVQKGTTKTCVVSPGLYTFTPESCHRFSEATYKWNTAEPTLMSLVATLHTVTAAVKSSMPGTFQLMVSHQDSSTALLQPKSKTESGKEYYFELMVREREEIVLTPTSPDNLFQYQPASHSFTVAADCMLDAAIFNAEKALFINGRVTPAVAGVEITVEAGAEKHVFYTDESGAYKAGPLDNSLKYDIAANMKGYMLSPLDDTGNFEAFKLAEVIVDILDETEVPLPGVVVSMSGGKSYRQNSMTGDDGGLVFHSLLPGEYFLRPAMKEYNFEPPSKMIIVRQGDTINIKVKGLRVAYSAMGSTISLTGVPEADVAIEARGLGENCLHYQEEAVSDTNGAFRIRGLLPKCEYSIGLKAGDGFNKHIERMLPATVTVKVSNQDITGLRLLMLRHFNQMEVVGTVEAPKEHLNTLSVKVYRDDVADSPLHTVKLSNHPFFILPPMMADGKTYSIHLESTLSTVQYSYRTSEVSFVANSSFKQLKLRFKPTLRNLDAEMNQNTVAGLLLAVFFICLVVNYERVAPVVEWALEAIKEVMANRTVHGDGRPSLAADIKKTRSKGRRNS